MAKTNKTEAYSLDELLSNGEALYKLMSCIGTEKLQQFIEKGLIFLAQKSGVDIEDEKEVKSFLKFATTCLKDNIQGHIHSWIQSKEE